MPKLERITIDPAVMGGKPCIRGLRVTVGTIVGLVAAGKTRDEILHLYPYLEAADIDEALFRNKLAPEGTNEGNTEVVEDVAANRIVGRTIKFLGKLRTRFATLFLKCAGAGFVILVAIAPLIPKDTPIFIPLKDDSVVGAQDQGISLHDFAKFPQSGVLQIYISQLGVNLPSAARKADATYDVQPGEKFILVSGNAWPPPNYVCMKTGSFAA